MVINPEELNWQMSAPVEIDSDWIGFEAEIPINPEKELVAIEIELVNEEDLEVYFDDLSIRKNLLNAILGSSNKTFIPVPGGVEFDPIDMTVFGAVEECSLVSVFFVPEEDIQGHSNDYAQLQIIKDPVNEVLATKTFVQGADTQARVVTAFGPVDPDLALLKEGQSLRLSKVDYGGGMAIPKGLLIIQWDYT